MDKAIAHLERVVALRERALGVDHPEVAQARLSLAEAHWQKRNIPVQGKLDESLPLYERAPRSLEKTSGLESTDAAGGGQLHAVNPSRRGQAVTTEKEDEKAINSCNHGFSCFFRRPTPAFRKLKGPRDVPAFPAVPPGWRSV